MRRNSILVTLFWIIVIFAGVCELAVGILLKDHIMGCILILAALAGNIVMCVWKKRKAIHAAIAVILLLIGLAAAAFTRPNRSISFMGNLQSNAMLFNTVVIKHMSPEELAASSQYEPYDSSSWKAPAGYTNEEISLSHCKGYLLEKENGNHDRIIYQIHGGGYILGFLRQYNTNAVMLSRCWDDADVFSIDYRTAAVEPYPAAIDDAVEGYRWLLEQGYSHENIVVTGDSAGGGLSLGMTLRLRDEGEDLPRCLVLGSPWADVSQEGDSYTYNRKTDSFFGSLDDDAVGRNALSTAYADSDSVYNPYISPVYADFTGMPPMQIQVADTEMLLSDSLTVAERAEAAGVPVELIRYKGLWHVFYIGEARFREQREAWNAIRDYLHSTP